MIQDDICMPILCAIYVTSGIIWLKSLVIKNKKREVGQIIYMKPSLSTAWFTFFLCLFVTFFTVENPLKSIYVDLLITVPYLLGDHYYKYWFDDNAIYKLNPFTKKITTLNFEALTSIEKSGFHYKLTGGEQLTMKIPSHEIYHGVWSFLSRLKPYLSNIDLTAAGSLEAELEII
jgi:hypothetical protein